MIFIRLQSHHLVVQRSALLPHDGLCILWQVPLTKSSLGGLLHFSALRYRYQQRFQLSDLPNADLQLSQSVAIFAPSQLSGRIFAALKNICFFSLHWLAVAQTGQIATLSSYPFSRTHITRTEGTFPIRLILKNFLSLSSFRLSTLSESCGQR